MAGETGNADGFAGREIGPVTRTEGAPISGSERPGHGLARGSTPGPPPASRSGRTSDRRRPLAVMRELAPGTDRYGAEVTVTSEGLWHFQVEAWGDPIARWRHDAAIKVPLGQDVELTLADGAVLFKQAADEVRTPRSAAIAQRREAAAARAALEALAGTLQDTDIPALPRLPPVPPPAIPEILTAFPLRHLVTRSASYPVIVHRERALYGSWYEFFPRSEGAEVDRGPVQLPKSGTLRTAAPMLDAIARMGFDVVYLPPVHP